MVAVENDQIEVNSPATANNNAAAAVPSLGRQSSIYSLTLDEFQNTMCESGKNFGSMNMDEFLNSIWTAEENQNNHPHAAQPHHEAVVSTVAQTMAIVNPQGGGLARQGSLSLPAPLCRKTVEEVWSEIQRGGRGGAASSRSGQSQPGGPGGPAGPVHQRQQTFGEMTLEDFLIKAGVVRDAGGAPPAPPPPVVRQQPPVAAAPTVQYGMYQNGSNPHLYGPSPVPVMAAVPGGFPANGTAAGGGEDSAAYIGMGKRNNGYVPAPGTVSYGNGGGYGTGMSPVSPLVPEMVDGSGRKRTLDGPVEKVVERRQRRMIKNRESAARSRARKQAYTVELEAELNQLREENSQLKQALGELERQRNQQYVEEQRNEAPQCRGNKVEERLRLMRRSKSCPL